MKFLLGVDEAGRGPLAGPVAVGIVRVPAGFDVAKEFPGVADSKQLTHEKREEIFLMLEARVMKGDVRFTVEFEDHCAIDEHGIVRCVRRCISRGVGKLAPKSADVFIKLDGLLKAPPRYAQETIIRGDESEPIISLASIAAKVMRDRLMTALALDYPLYGFAAHKGYGTKGHYDALVAHGPRAIHRRSYLHLAERVN